MRLPCEYVASSMLPNLRIRVAHILKEQGLTQMEIAEIFSVKQPVIQSYLKRKVTCLDDPLEMHLSLYAKEIASMIMKKTSMPTIMRTICTNCKRLRIAGPICVEHKKMIPELSSFQNCDICSGFGNLPSLSERTIILTEIRELIIKLSTLPQFTEWVPEIGSQVGHCVKNAQSLDDVASIPGRIIKVKNTIATVREPEFGTSKTISPLLIKMQQLNPSITWVVSIKNKPTLSEVLKRKKKRFIITEKFDTNIAQTLPQLEKERKLNNLQWLLDKGAEGYEAIAYLFASTEEEVIKEIKAVILE